MNLLRGGSAARAFDLAGSRIDGAPVESGEVVLGVRPHEVEVHAPRAGVAAIVVSSERLGPTPPRAAPRWFEARDGTALPRS